MSVGVPTRQFLGNSTVIILHITINTFYGIVLWILKILIGYLSTSRHKT